MLQGNLPGGTEEQARRRRRTAGCGRWSTARGCFCTGPATDTIGAVHACLRACARARAAECRAASGERRRARTHAWRLASTGARTARSPQSARRARPGGAHRLERHEAAVAARQERPLRRREREHLAAAGGRPHGAGARGGVGVDARRLVPRAQVVAVARPSERAVRDARAARVPDDDDAVRLGRGLVHRDVVDERRVDDVRRRRPRRLDGGADEPMEHAACTGLILRCGRARVDGAFRGSTARSEGTCSSLGT